MATLISPQAGSTPHRIHIRVLAYDECVLAAELQHDGRQSLGSRGHDLLADDRRAHKDDLVATWGSVYLSDDCVLR